MKASMANCVMKCPTGSSSIRYGKFRRSSTACDRPTITFGRTAPSGTDPQPRKCLSRGRHISNAHDSHKVWYNNGGQVQQLGPEYVRRTTPLSDMSGPRIFSHLAASVSVILTLGVQLATAGGTSGPIDSHGVIRQAIHSASTGKVGTHSGFLKAHLRGTGSGSPIFKRGPRRFHVRKLPGRLFLSRKPFNHFFHPLFRIYPGVSVPPVVVVIVLPPPSPEHSKPETRPYVSATPLFVVRQCGEYERIPLTALRSPAEITRDELCTR